MAIAPHGNSVLATHLAGELGLAHAADISWLERILRCFPVPTVRHVPYLLRSLERLLDTVPWAPELLADAGLLEPGSRLIPQITRLMDEKPSVYETISDKQLAKDFRGGFLLAGSLLWTGAGPNPPKGPEALRVVLVACQWRWVDSATPYTSAIDDLASAIRGVGRSALDEALIYRLGKATNLVGFVQAADGIKHSVHGTLAQAWRDHFEPELRGIQRPTRLPGPRPAREIPKSRGAGHPALEPAGPTAPKPGDASDAGRGKEALRENSERTGVPEDELIEKLQHGVRRGWAPRPPAAPEPLPEESPEEVTPRVLTLPLPSAPANDDARAVLRHQVRQAIWNTNYLLLPNHPDVLPLPDYVRVVKALVGLLDSVPADPGVRAGASGLLVQALTGRTPRSLGTLAVLDTAVEDHDPHRMELLLHEGAFRLACFWQVEGEGFQPSYFRPNEDQSLHLESVRQDFLLLLAPTFARILVANAEALRALAAMPVGSMEGLLRQSARQVGEGSGVDFTIGQLRSSFSAHLFEQCRDTAATQLICADTLGQSVAPLSYYAPRANALARVHWTFQGRLLGTDTPLPHYPLSEDRVGTHLLVRSDSARSLARAPASVIHCGVSRLLEDQRVGDVQRAVVGHLAGMLMAVATHRPTEALTTLTLSDFLIDGDAGAALFRDKVHDAAHDPRLVALPQTVCRQLQAYLEHLVGLAERMPGLAKQVQRILQGKAPLLMALTEQGQLVPMSLKALKDCMPPAWKALPMNWGRHWMRTHAVERGMSPELVSMQLGHLEAVGYPFSGASPTEPWRFVEEVSVGWDELARNQGWQVVRGFTAEARVEPKTLTPLRSWRQSMEAHHSAQRAEAKEWREAMKSKLRAYREQAEEMVLAHPELVQAGIVSRYLDRRSGLARHALTRPDFERIRDEVYESAGEDLALAIAGANAVCEVARVVNARTRQIAETPGKVFKLRRPLDNAFVPGMMEAVRQVRALRDHVGTLAADNPKERWADMPSACACAALAMALFGFCDSPDQIRGAISHRKRLQRPASLEDAVLVPWGDAPHQVLALRGVAAIVLARLEWKRGQDEVPAWGEVDARLAELLPGWALGERPSSGRAAGVLESLCETVAVANRYELSPGARRANAPTGGSTPAHLREQLALLDGDPVGSVIRDWEEDGAPSDPGGPQRELATRKGNARSQYLALCAAFPDYKKDTHLPLIRATIPSGQAATPASRAKLVAEIKAHLEVEEPERRLQPIVQMLAAWVVSLILHGTPKKEAPALVTVETYLTRIGGPLVHVFGQSSMTDVDDAELEDAYLVAIESKSETRKGLRGKTAAAVLLFHDYAYRHFGLPEVDLSGIRFYLGSDPEALSDARLILPAEREAIISRLAGQAGEPGPEARPRDIRVLRQASQVMPLFGMAGLRRGEALGLQFRDVAQGEGRLRVRIRPNSSRRLKTVRGRRVIDVPVEATTVGGLTLLEWVQTERGRLRSRSLETAFVFTPADAPFDATGRTEVAEVCLRACREVTGRRYSRLHAFRHLVAMESTTPVFLTGKDLADLTRHMLPAQESVPTSGVALPRDLQARVVGLGHADPATTLDFYHHLPWLLRSRSDAWLTSHHVNRLTLAPLLGLSLHALDWAVKKRPGRERGLAWLDVSADVREVPVASAGPEAKSDVANERPDTKLRGRWTARELGAVLDEVARVGSLDKVLTVRGASPGDAAPLRLLMQPLEGRLGRRLLEERGRALHRGAPRRCVRRVDAGRRLEVLWDWFDEDEDDLRSTIASLAESLYEYLHPTQADRVCLPPMTAAQLRRLLLATGVSEGQILSEPGEAGLQVMRILRSESTISLRASESNSGVVQAGSKRYLGVVLKRILLVIRAVVRGH